MPASVNVYAELEIGLHAVQTEAIGGEIPYQVELRFTNPNSQAERTPKRGECRINYEELLECQRDRQMYGHRLSARLFGSEAIRREWGQIKTAVEAEGLFLRVRVSVGPTAPRLHFLRWEMLTDPDTDTPLATSEKLLFSRFLASQDWRPIRLRPKKKLRAVIAVSAPTNLADYRLAEIDSVGEVERVRLILGAMEATEIGLGEPLTLNRLMDSLRGGVDVLYLVCHGTLSKTIEPILFLQDNSGRASPTPGNDFALRVSELPEPPRLAVLISCESAGKEDAPPAGEEPMASQAALAPRLAEAGIPAILAMQGKISMETVKLTMPVFFRELLQDGQIDRALAVARGSVLSRRDSWMLALFLRLKSGRIWYEAGFTGSGNDFAKWRSISRRVHDGKFIPILGPDIADDLYGGMREVSARLAVQHSFPMAAAERSDVAKMMQYLSINQDRSYAQDAIQKQLLLQIVERNHLQGEVARKTLPAMLDQIVEQHRSDQDDPYRILANLPASIYVTASPETMLFKAVKAAGKEPEALLCSWRPTETNHPKEPQPARDPSPLTPAIYHVFGVFGVKDSLVLTEDDFFDYLIATSTYKLMPKVVRGSLMESSLLFLGFRLDDWTFRVLFRLIMTLEGSTELRQYSHVGVQVNPDEHSLTDVERARKYLESYFGRDRSGGRGEPSIDIYWGTAADFLKELRQRLSDTEDEVATPALAEAASGWF